LFIYSVHKDERLKIYPIVICFQHDSHFMQNIVYDSTYSGVGSANREVNYCGQAGDYFNFVNDSIIYTKEGSALDTLNYRFTSSNTIIISSFGIILNGVPETSQIINLTSNNLIIVAPVMPTPAGAFGRKVGLSR